MDGINSKQNKVTSRIPLFITTGLCLLLMLWAGSDQNSWNPKYPLTGQQVDYYNQLVDGLLDGGLSMKIPPTASGELPILMDASLYHGKYYMYFGIVPALLTLLPYSLLTGHDLQLNGAILLLVSVGFLVNLRLYILIRSRYFQKCTKSIETCVILLLAFGSSTPTLIFNPGFYELALAGGYLCISAAILALHHSLHYRRQKLKWLATASFCVGISVGCRPTYVLALPILLIPYLIHSGSRKKKNNFVDLVSYLKAAMIPAGLVGLSLMAYNYGRFDNPLEFGFKYQQNALMNSGLPFVRANFIWPNLNWYYLTPPVLSPHFPYVLPINASLRPLDYYGYERIHGQWLVLPLLAISIAAVILTIKRKIKIPSRLIALTCCALFAFAAVFCALLTFGFRANRYVTDFQPTLILAIALITGFTITHSSPAGYWRRIIYRLLFCTSATILAIFNYLVGIQWMDRLAEARPAIYEPLAYYGNYPSYWLYRIGLLNYGPCRFEVSFPSENKINHEPLFTTGTDTYTDCLYVARYPENQAQFYINHYDHGNITSNLLSIVPNKTYVMEIELGSLYPPKFHPYFNDWSDLAIAKAKTSNRVQLNETEIINNLQSSYDASPHTVRLGQNPYGSNNNFSGQIGKLQRLKSRSSSAIEFGVWRMSLTLPANTYKIGQPLLASGISGHGNMLFVESLSQNQIRFGLDEWGSNLFTNSSILNIDSNTEHLIEVFVGPQVTKQKIEADWAIRDSDLKLISSELQVWLDGKLAWQTTIHGNYDTYNNVGVGTNPQGFSTTQGVFGGVFKNTPFSDLEKKDFVRRCIDQLPKQPSTANEFGLWRLSVKLPPSVLNIGQPLITFGKSGDGYMLLIEATSPNKIRFGFDEWGQNTFTNSPFFGADLNHTHTIEIFIGRQFEKKDLEASWQINPDDITPISSLLLVWVDGVLTWKTTIHGNHRIENIIGIGTNAQGFSTAQDVFKGVLKNTPFSETEKKEFLQRCIHASRTDTTPTNVK